MQEDIVNKIRVKDSNGKERILYRAELLDDPIIAKNIASVENLVHQINQLETDLDIMLCAKESMLKRFSDSVNAYVNKTDEVNEDE